MIAEKYMQRIHEEMPAQGEVLSVKDGTAFFVHSLAHSQGNKITQRLLFEYYKHLHPEVTFDLNTLFKMREGAWEVAKAHLGQRGHRKEELGSAEQTFKKDFSEMFEILRSSEPIHPPNISLLARRLIEHDLRFTGLLRSRKNRKKSANSSQGYRNDPQYSFIVEHALRGADTGNPVFNQMYAEIGNVLNEEQLHFPKLRTLILYYNAAHPDRPVWNVQPGSPVEKIKFWIQRTHRNVHRV